jgi:hypothetical protein
VASRLFARAVPLALGAVAAGIWLRRRQLERPALREVTGELPPAVPPPRPKRAPVRFARIPRRPIDIVTIVDDLLGAAR